jgi:hypothetical protein
VAYSSSPSAQGVSPIGTLVRTNLNECTGERTGADIISVANLGASVITGLSDFAIYGADSVVFDGASGISYGNVGSGRRMQFKKSGGAELLQIVGDLHAARDLHIGQSNVLADYVQAGDRVNVDRKSSLSVNGAVSESSECASPLLMGEVFVRLPPGSSRATVPAGGSLALDPGGYRSLQVGRLATLSLRSGTYDIGDLDINGDGVTLQFDVSGGEVTVNIDSWKLSKASGLRFVVPAGSSGLVRINYAGHGNLMFTNAVLQGSILAPDAGVRLDEGSQVLGALHAQRVEIGTGVVFRHHRYLEPLKIDPVCLTALDEALQTPLVGGGQ